MSPFIHRSYAVAHGFKRWAILLTGLLTSASLPALSCTCVIASSVKDALQQANFVGLGIIKARTSSAFRPLLRWDKYPSFTDDSLPLYPYRYTIELEKVYKGTKASRTVYIYSGTNSADCGYAFIVGRRYVIYADTQYNISPVFNNDIFPEGAFLATSSCTRTQESSDEEIKQLRKVAKAF